MKKNDIIKQKQGILTFDIVNKFENMSATVSELRTGIFAPIEKISANSQTYKKFIADKKRRTIKTAWGDVSIIGNILTQTHRDLLDCIFAVADKTIELQNGDIAVYFNRAKILKSYSDSGKNSCNYAWIKQKLQEIQTTAIEFKKDNEFYSFTILDTVGFSEKENSFGIVFSKNYRKYVEQQLTVDYKSELPRLLKVESALLKAIIRFFWTHQHSNVHVMQLLEALGYPITSETAIWTAKRELKNNRLMLENEFGIIYNHKESLLYKQTLDTLNFMPPLTQGKNFLSSELDKN